MASPREEFERDAGGQQQGARDQKVEDDQSTSSVNCIATSGSSRRAATAPRMTISLVLRMQQGLAVNQVAAGRFDCAPR